jgi:putative phosphoesterase
MKLGIISDIHGNKPALDATLSELHDTHAVDTIVCVGDVVGLLGWPNYCVNRIREHAEACVYGNHDTRFFESRDWMPVHEHEVVEYEHVMDDLTDENLSWLRNLPASTTIDIDGESVMVVHARPNGDDPDGREKGNAGIPPKDYVSIETDAIGGEILLLGHTHKQHAVNLSKFQGKDGLVVNPGSTGFPFDYGSGYQYGDDSHHSGKASFAVVDTDTQDYTLESVVYNSQPVHDHLRETGLL